MVCLAVEVVIVVVVVVVVVVLSTFCDVVVDSTAPPVQAAEAAIRLNIVVRSFDFKSATPLVV